MLDSQHYIPVLKSKAGELQALREIDQDTAKHFTPLLEIIPIPSKWQDGEDAPIPARSIEDHCRKVVADILASWGGDAFIDGDFIQEYTLPDDSEPIKAVLDGLTDGGLNVIPVVGMDCYAEYIEAVTEYSAKHNVGLCVRVRATDLGELDDLKLAIDSLLELLGTTPEKVDLVFDHGAISPELVASIKASAHIQIKSLPHLTKWRSLTFISGGFPRDLSGVSQHSIEEIDRCDWDVWLRLNKQLTNKRFANYGDYVVTHPDLVEIDPRIMRMSPKIKYTDDLRWVVTKGEAYRRKKDPKNSVPASVQYPKMAKKLMEHSAWKGSGFSWGDTYIEECANGQRVGAMKDWVAVGTNHHLSFVVNQLANYLGT